MFLLSKKYFTPEEANELLPYVRAELSFMQEAKRTFYKLYQQREEVKKLLPVDESELFAVECRLEFMELEAKARITRLLEKGVQVKDVDIGLFDFPAMINGEEVLLCWREGESEITHYHGLHEGFQGRKKLE
ncbi:DUF2203 domain-containing protein [Brevibacillus centrosporus]|uniref:DUF2203 domain-containing protein n=1 Tax=Brevibacillus centrosporus TaxID=54910 RepID=UPI001FEB0CE5|nr:DUF2203 domain-containing protein [Brevibacillus centrosporus]MED4910809.1 DUF2203 domain-containing protein [Brevibacillus centrosporus]